MLKKLSEYFVVWDRKFYPERRIVFKKRTSFDSIFLYHETKTKNTILKNDGILFNNHVYDDEYKNYIILTSNRKHAETHSKNFFLTKPTILLCRVNTKSLKFIYNTKYGFDIYFYFETIPPENIIFSTDSNYINIQNNEKYLEN